jgi:hypothetical protein
MEIGIFYQFGVPLQVDPQHAGDTAGSGGDGSTGKWTIPVSCYDSEVSTPQWVYSLIIT